MRVQNVTNGSIKFQSIKLSGSEIQKADVFLRKLVLQTNSEKEYNIAYKKLINLLNPHIKYESAIRAGRRYIQEEIYSEIMLKLAEFLKNLKSETKISDVVNEINKYKPSKYAYQPNLIIKSLNEPKYNDESGLQKIDLITEDNLLRPDSETMVENYRKKLDKYIEQNNLSTSQKQRLKSRASGRTFKSISEEESVSTQVVKSSIRKSILKIQNNENIIPQNVIQKIKIISKVLNCDEKKLKKAIILRPDLLFYKPETLKNNIRLSAEMLGCAEDKFLKYALKYPSLFYQKPQTIEGNVQKLSTTLNCSGEDFIKAALKLPEILLRKAESLKDNIQKSSKILKCSEEDLTITALRHPQIFCKKPEILNKNAHLFSELFNTSFEEAVNIMLKYPTLFYRDLIKIKNRVGQNAKSLGISEEVFLKTAVKSPILLCLNPEKILQNYNNLTYYRTTQNLESQHLLPILSDEMWYVKILANLINQAEKSKVIKPRNVNAQVIEKYLTDNPEKFYSFEIPAGFAAEKIIEYAKQISEKVLGKNIFDIKIKDSN